MGGTFPLLLAAALASPAPATPLPSSPAGPEHAGEIRAFAIVMAVSQVASDRCADIRINTGLLKAIRDHIGYEEARDRDELIANGREILAELGRAVARAPSLQGWCDGVYAMYGPTGTMVRGLMLR